MVKPNRYPTNVVLRVLWSLVLLVVLCAARPLTAAARSEALDVATIDAFVREQVQRHGIPGLALAVVDGDQIVYQSGYGTADGAGHAVTPQTPFVLASASKPVTALAVMQLVEADLVELDAPIQRYVPDFELADPGASAQITVRHLLQHTSGIPELGCQNSRFGAATLAQFVAVLRTIEPAAPAGTHYEYCSGNYNVLGRLIEVVSGQSFAGYIDQHVFTPLGMRHSFTSERAAIEHGLAQGYRLIFGQRVPFQHPYDVAQMPSGFLIASAEDMAAFLIAQLNGGRFGTSSILSPDGVAAMQAPGVATGSGERTYGLGWMTGPIGEVPAVFHSGDHPNVHTLVMMQPGTRRGAVLLLNVNNIPALATAVPDIQNGVARLLAEQEPVPGAVPLPTLYVLIDALLGGILALALWSLLRVRRWSQRMEQRHHRGRGHILRLALRLVWDWGVPLTLLLGARLLLGGMGAQSWAEGLWLFPDFIWWLWVFALVMLLTGATRLVCTLRVLRRTGGEHRLVAPAAATRRRPT